MHFGEGKGRTAFDIEDTETPHHFLICSLFLKYSQRLDDSASEYWAGVFIKKIYYQMAIVILNPVYA